MRFAVIVLTLLSWFGDPPLPAVPSAVSIHPYVQWVTSDAFTVCWETQKKTPTSLRWGTTPDCPLHIDDAAPRKRHEVALAGLQPGTVYWYRAGNDDMVAPVAVKTDLVAAGSIRIAVIGDTHSAKDDHTALVREMLDADPQFVLHTGDLAVVRGGDRTRDFFDVEQPLLRSLALYPVLGNHDDGSRFDALFLLPRKSGEEHYYLVRRGAVAVIALDTNQSVSARSRQGRWLAQTLSTLDSDPTVVFRIVEMHWGPFDSGSGDGSNTEVRSSLVPLFERYRVDIVFSGHNHNYERSTVHGVRYVVTGGGGGLGGKNGTRRHIVLRGWWTEIAESAHHYCLVEIDGPNLHLTAREARTGRIIDEFTQVSRSAAAMQNAR